MDEWKPLESHPHITVQTMRLQETGFPSPLSAPMSRWLNPTEAAWVESSLSFRLLRPTLTSRKLPRVMTL
jgi:hypothetical protein